MKRIEWVDEYGRHHVQWDSGPRQPVPDDKDEQ